MSLRLAAGERVPSGPGAPMAVPVAAVVAFGLGLAAFLTYLVVRVPGGAPPPPPRGRPRHWPAILVAIAVVSAVDAVVIRALRQHPSSSSHPARAVLPEP